MRWLRKRRQLYSPHRHHYYHYHHHHHHPIHTHTHTHTQSTCKHSTSCSGAKHRSESCTWGRASGARWGHGIVGVRWGHGIPVRTCRASMRLATVVPASSDAFLLAHFWRYSARVPMRLYLKNHLYKGVQPFDTGLETWFSP